MLSSLALVVVIVIDQFRTDELLRAQHQLNPAGIGLLVNQGIFYDDAHHNQFFNMTCPGHTGISTGAMPGLHGIMLNDDWDSKTGKEVYCVSDKEHHWIDADADSADNSNLGTSAKRILVSTLGDEMKLEWGDDSKVVAVSVKDRSAIALGGHHPDAAYWHAPKSRKWTSSDAFLPLKKLPSWVLDFNKSHPNNKLLHKEEYESSEQSINDLTDMALAVAHAESLGTHKNPDILWVSYSAHDFVGHITGDDSPELRATIRAEDRSIARLISELKKSLKGKKLIVALTADHGAGINTEAGAKYNIPGGKQNYTKVLQKVNECLVPEHVKVDDNYSLNLYLAADTKDKEGARKKVKACLNAMTDSVWQAFTRDEIMTNQLPQTPWLKNLAGSYNPMRGSDVVGVLNPYWNSEDNRLVNHETPYDYDSWVPLALWWPGIHKHLIHRRVEVTSLAPTLARILNTRRPSGATSEYLTEVLDGVGN